MTIFTGHKEVKWNDTPFDTYLLLNQGGILSAYGLSDSAPLDLQELLELIFPDDNVEIIGANYTDQYAQIITDGRPCNSPIVWESSDYLLEEK